MKDKTEKEQAEELPAEEFPPPAPVSPKAVEATGSAPQKKDELGHIPSTPVPLRLDQQQHTANLQHIQESLAVVTAPGAVHVSGIGSSPPPPLQPISTEELHLVNADLVDEENPKPPFVVAERLVDARTVTETLDSANSRQRRRRIWIGLLRPAIS